MTNLSTILPPRISIARHKREPCTLGWPCYFFVVVICAVIRGICIHMSDWAFTIQCNDTKGFT